MTQCNRWLRRAALLVATTAALVAPATAGAITVGQSNPPYPLGCGADAEVAQTAVASGASYTVPAGNWTVTSWETQGANGDMKLKIFRPTGNPGEYLVVGESAVQTLSSGPQSYPTSITGVQGGDLIGMWTASSTYCAAFTGDGSDTFSFSYSDTAAGSTVTTPFSGTSYRLSIAATLVGPAAGTTCNGKTPTINYAGDNSPRTINGTAGDDVIYAGGGNDTINGNGGNDTICGVGGDDVVRGGTGDDYVFGGPGADDLGGQAGNDTVSGGRGNDRVNGAEGNDKVAGGDGMDIANGGDGDDNVNGGADDDVLAGNAGNDVCVGNAGNDRTTLNGGCERFDSATVSNNTPATTAAGDRAVVASAEDPDEANGNAATLMPAGTANSGLDVEGGNSTAFGDGV
jgi:Ca2+-binding RTX toxin-like protein